MKNAIFAVSFVSIFLTGCAQKVSLIEPGYYQEGKYIEARYQPAFYDAYGNLHTDKQIMATYQDSRFVRPTVVSGTVSTQKFSQYISTDWMSQPVWVGAVGGAVITAAVIHGGLPYIALGAATGAYVGKSMEDQFRGTPFVSGAM